jgi:hypothetical protein
MTLDEPSCNPCTYLDCVVESAPIIGYTGGTPLRRLDFLNHRYYRSLALKSKDGQVA